MFLKIPGFPMIRKILVFPLILMFLLIRKIRVFLLILMFRWTH
jgi:hypothetical protein